MASRLSEALQTQERSQAWLARRVGMSTATVSRVIAGLQVPSRPFIYRASEALGIPADELFPEQTTADAA